MQFYYFLIITFTVYIYLNPTFLVGITKKQFEFKPTILGI